MLLNWKGPKKPSTSTTTSVSNPFASIPLPNLPQDIVVSILKRLPVKSILRFKCVSKEWLSLFSTPKFVSMHREETSMNPLNHYFIIHSLDEEYFPEMSLLNVNSTKREEIPRFKPFPVMFRKMNFVGCVNGLMCLYCPPLGHIILSNPAMNLYKPINLCTSDENTRKISLGFAYDSVNDDYKIIRIACLRPSQEPLLRSHAEIYSATLDSWERVPIDFPFLVSTTRCCVIAKGIPYWTAYIYQANSQCKFTKVLMYYDMQTRSFKYVTLPRLAVGTGFVEWKGNLGMIVPFRTIYREHFVDILVYDEKGMCWDKISSHGPVASKMVRYIQCSKNGMILSKTQHGTLMLYDPPTSHIKELCVPVLYSVKAFSYTESLVTIKGMKDVNEHDKDMFWSTLDDLEDDDDDEQENDDINEDELAAFFSFLNMD